MPYARRHTVAALAIAARVRLAWPCAADAPIGNCCPHDYRLDVAVESVGAAGRHPGWNGSMAADSASAARIVVRRLIEPPGWVWKVELGLSSTGEAQSCLPIPPVTRFHSGARETSLCLTLAPVGPGRAGGAGVLAEDAVVESTSRGTLAVVGDLLRLEVAQRPYQYAALSVR